MFCKTCPFWSHGTDPSWGTCQLATTKSGEPENETSLACASDYDRYYAELDTNENFGCVQHPEFKKEEKG